MYRHTNQTYAWIILIWAVMMLIFGYLTYQDGIHVTFNQGHPVMAWLEIGNFIIFTSLFIWFSVSNLIFPSMYQLIRRPEAKQERKIIAKPLPSNWHPKVDLLYTTYNDFIPSALEECSHQTWPNTQTIILDNSTDPHYLKMIHRYLQCNPDTKYIRNVPNHHAKAGNLDNFLCHEGKDTYDYFVILDSDELLQPDFVEKCLHFFYYSHHLGILQCNHISGRNINSFMDTFSHSGNTFWPVQNSVRSSENGCLRPKTLTKRGPRRLAKGDCICIGLGHGVMVSRSCFDDIGKFPYMVAEDLCSSVKAILRGWNIKFATQIYGNEEFPVDMKALMIRSSKFCSANFQFFRQYGKRILLTTQMTLRQKIDLLSFTLSVPLFAFMYISLLLTGILFPLNHIQTGYSVLLMIPTLVCYFSQTIADSFFEYQSGMRFWQIIIYELQAMLLYGSFYYLSVKCTILAVLGRKAKFNVTPKNNQKITLWQALLDNWQSCVFSLITIGIIIMCSRSSWILLSFVPGCFGWIMSLKGNHQSKADRQKLTKFRYYNQIALNKGQKGSILKWND